MFKKAMAIATAAHADQVDLAGKPYIEHVMRVALGVPCGDAKIVAILHDVIEDTPWTLEMLKAEGFSPTVLEALDAVTHRKGKGWRETYKDYVLRVKANKIATVVKLADLADNMDLTRLPHKVPTAADLYRMEKYIKSKQTLEWNK